MSDKPEPRWPQVCPFCGAHTLQWDGISEYVPGLHEWDCWCTKCHNNWVMLWHEDRKSHWDAVLAWAAAIQQLPSAEEP